MTLPPTEQQWRAAEAARRKIMEKYMSENPKAHRFAGMSILDILWQEMDSVYDILIEEGKPDTDPAKKPIKAMEEYRAWGELRGQAQGLAYAIAVLTNPYATDVPAIKAEARRRYEAAQGND